MLTWAASHGSEAEVDIFCFLDSQGYPAGVRPGFDSLLAIGAADRLEASSGEAFSRLKEWAAERQDWIFGHFAYDLAAETEPDPSAGPKISPKADPIGFPDLFFFIPRILIELGPAEIRIGSFRDDQEAIWRQIRAVPYPNLAPIPPVPLTAPNRPEMVSWQLPPFTPRLSRAEYLERLAALRRHILYGDCYEINFCQEFYTRPESFDPLTAWWSLSRASPNPFSAFYRLKERYLLCASPERYLKKTGSLLCSQPMKGTAARHSGQPETDAAVARELFQSAKDRSENVMVVDLVRNDLAKICIPGSVRAEELFGVYPFPHVFQMISTISGTLSPEFDWTDAIRATFPMGSMTGAPKNRVVSLIDRYEPSRRGIFSGAVGYVTPEGDFDFNVVIRSLLYNRSDRYLSYQVGSGVTFYSDAEAEYEECLVKARGILEALGTC